jgi:ferric-chelate reductase
MAARIVSPIPLHNATIDKIRSKARAEEYPHQILYALSTFIIVLALFRLVSGIYSNFSGPAVRKRDAEAADVSPIPSAHISLRRLPLACVNIFRVIAFRWTAQLGRSYTLSLTDIFLALSYIAIIFSWTFVNSMPHLFRMSLLISSSMLRNSISS